MSAELFKVTIFVVGVFLIASPAHAQGIRQGGSDTHSGLRQHAPSQNQMGQNNRPSQSSQRLGGAASSEARARRALRQEPTQKTGNALKMNKQGRDAQAGRALIEEANKLKARFRQDQSEAAGTAHEHRYGFVVAFMDTTSLLKRSFVKDLKRLKNVDGIKFLLFQSEHSVENWSLNKAKKLEGVDPIMARDDRGGKVAKQYGVKKFPTVLYELPNHEVAKIYVPHSLNAVFQHIRKVKRNQRARR